MPDEVRKNKTHPYAALPTTQHRPIMYFTDLESALNLHPLNEIYEVWESRNRTDGDGFTQWRESFELLNKDDNATA